MGYTRSLKAISKHFDLLKEVLREPDRVHDLEVPDWNSAQKLAYQLREAVHAAHFHHGYEHIARLRSTHTFRVENNVVRVLPKFTPEMVKSVQPIPMWAKYGQRKSTIICEKAESLIDILATMKELTADSPWTDVVYPAFRFDEISSAQRQTLYTMASDREWWVLDLAESGMSLVKMHEGEGFSSAYYTPEDEEEYSQT